MKKNDKLVVLLGVVILVIASIGVYYWMPEEITVKVAELEDIIGISGSFSTVPAAITVSDSDPFYALIATPLAVHYNSDGEKKVIPLLIENMISPSRAVTRVKTQLGISHEEVIDDSKCAKEWSLDLAKKYWKKSKAVLLIEYNERGYNLGVAATPIASYLSIPVIVTDELDQDVKDVLSDLGVEYSLVCGDIEGYGESIKFDDVDEIIDATIEIVIEKFGDVEYITLANPRDAWPPEVINSTRVLYKRGKVNSANEFPSHIFDGENLEDERVSFSVPEDYKYALVKLYFKNLEDPENIEKFGDLVQFMGGITKFLTTGGSPSERDVNGNLEHDSLYYETVLYDCGGKNFDQRFHGVFHTLRQADYEVEVTIDNLSNPYYPLTKQLSSIAPYLTVYHKGIIVAKPEFAFVADDDKLLDGRKLPGNTQPLHNPGLIPLINRHVFQTIHKPLNNLLAKLTDIDLNDEDGKKWLTKECKRDPFYIALVGDTTMLPQYYYRSPHNDPYKKRDVVYGTCCPSDFIYGNVDPQTYFMQPHIGPEDTDDDLYTYYPEVENIVGRIIGWDAQDASALITRTIFYDEIIEELDDWKDNAAVMTGAGAEVTKPYIITFIRKLQDEGTLIKFPTGEKHIISLKIKYNLEKGDFNVVTTERGRSQRVGYSDEALWEIKTDGLLNRLFFPRMFIKIIQGFENVYSLLSPQWWRAAMSDGSGVRGGEIQEDSNIIVSDSHAIWYNIEHGDIMMNLLGGPPILYQIIGRVVPIFGIRTPLENLGSYDVRAVSDMDMGPSVMFIEGCGSGKIDSLNPRNTISSTYLHAGVNAYISPTTYSAFYGILEPVNRWSCVPFLEPGVSLGLRGYIKALRDAKKGVFPPLHFCQDIFEKAYKKLIEDDVDIGCALRDARNDFLPDQANVTYLWSPQLTYVPTGNTGSVEAGGAGRVILEKYCAVYQLNLLGDPAFNPYEPCNEGI